MKYPVIALLVAILIALTTSAGLAQTCAPCPENAECALPECPTEEPTPDVPHIRLWNRSEHAMENIIVKFPDQHEDYADIASRQTSDYRAVELAYRYAYIRFVVHDEEQVIQPIDYVGETPLEPGYYTYALNIEDGAISLELLRVVATVEYQGGHCIPGLCHILTTLYSDGTLISENGNGDQTILAADTDLVQVLADEIAVADYAAIRSQSFTGTCPVAYDGQELIYTFYEGVNTEMLASCEYALDESLPLFVLIAEILATPPTES